MAAAGDPRNQRVYGEPPESARIPRKRPRPEGMAAGRRRLAEPQAMTFTARGWGSPRRPRLFATFCCVSTSIHGQRLTQKEYILP